MAHNVATVNQALPNRRWTEPVVITLSDTITAKNLWKDSRPYRFIMNVGTSGLVNIVWQSGAVIAIWVTQGGVVEGGYWSHAKSTGTDSGVSILGLIGMEARSS